MTNTELLTQFMTLREHLMALSHVKINRGHDLVLQALMRKVSKHATAELIHQQIVDHRATKTGVAQTIYINDTPLQGRDGKFNFEKPKLPA